MAEPTPADRTSQTLLSRLRRLDPNVRSLGVVSFFADLSSEAVYPLFPLFVTVVLGAPVAVLGLIEGIAEATASLTRYPFGLWSDRASRRRAFVLGGYTLSAVGKLILAVSFVWPTALGGRFFDRVGKGMRTAPRDALLAGGVPDDQRGLAFGFHRSLDTMGAVLGPLLALALVQLNVPVRWIFALAAIPGFAAVWVIWKYVRERAPAAPARAPSRRPHLPASPVFRRLLAASLIFAVGNSTNTFLLLRAHDVGLGVTAVILVYVLYNLTYAAGSLPLGNLSDRIGQVPLVVGGWIVFALVYLGFALAGSAWAVIVLFAVYGLYIAATEGTSKALISRAAPDAERASAMGLYDTAVGVASLIASTAGGLLWSAVGPWATFALGSAAATLAAIVLIASRPSQRA